MLCVIAIKFEKRLITGIIFAHSFLFRVTPFVPGFSLGGYHFDSHKIVEIEEEDDMSW